MELEEIDYSEERWLVEEFHAAELWLPGEREREARARYRIDPDHWGVYDDGAAYTF